MSLDCGVLEDSIQALRDDVDRLTRANKVLRENMAVIRDLLGCEFGEDVRDKIAKMKAELEYWHKHAREEFPDDYL